jgi:hypothetical protein
LDVASQRLLAAWAVKTVYLLELASRQQFPGARQVEGYQQAVRVTDGSDVRRSAHNPVTTGRGP